MILNSPVPFEEALALRSVQTLLGTELNSAEMSAVLRLLPAALRQRGFFSAGVYDFNILNAFYQALKSQLNRQPGDPSLNNFIRQSLAELNYDPGAAAGTIHDLTSFARLDVMLNTNLDIAQGYGQMVQSVAVQDDWPAWELYRSESRNVPRGDPSYKGDAGIAWLDRFQQSAQAAGDDDALACVRKFGRMAALISSPLWEHLGSDFDDSLGNPFPPFAWGSGMDVDSIIYSETVALGLLDPGEKVVRREIPDLNATLKAPVDTRNQELADALVQSLKDFGVKLDNGVLKFK